MQPHGVPIRRHTPLIVTPRLAHDTFVPNAGLVQRSLEIWSRPNRFCSRYERIDMALDPYSIALGAVGLYAIILHMGVVYLYTAKSYAENTLSAEEKDLTE